MKSDVGLICSPKKRSWEQFFESRHESLTGAAMSLWVMKFRLGMRITNSTILLCPCQNDCLAQDLLQAYRNTRPFVHTMIGNGIMEADLREAFDFSPKRHVLFCQNRGFSNVACDGNRFVWVQTSQALETTVDFLQSAEAQPFLYFECRFACIFISYLSCWYLPGSFKVKLELGFAICVVDLTSVLGGSFATCTSSRWAFRRNAKGIDSHWPWGSGVTGCLGDGGHKSLGTRPSQRKFFMD